MGKLRHLGLERHVGAVVELVGAVQTGTGATPESITATSTPLPVNPAFQYCWAPVIRVVLYSDPTSVAGAYIPAARAGVTATPSSTAATARVTSTWSPRRHDQATSRTCSCMDRPSVSGGGRLLLSM